MKVSSLTDMLEERNVQRSDFYGVYFILPATAMLVGLFSLWIGPRLLVIQFIAFILFLFPVFIWGTVLCAFTFFFLTHLLGPPVRKTRKFLVELIPERDDA